MNVKNIAIASGFGFLAGMTTLAHAVTPAGTIKNTAQLTYAGLVTPIEATVDITVTLVASQPVIVNETGDQTVASNAAISYTYQVTASANGSAAYTFTTTDVVGGGLTGNTASTVTNTITLGSTSAAVTTAAAGTQLKVPNDGDGDNTDVNDIAAGDTVVIAGVEYSVSTVTEEAGDAAAGLLTITFTTNVPATAVGEQILERQDITLAIADVGAPSGTITSSVVGATAGVADTAAVDAVTTVSVPVFEKWVRNVTTNNDNGTGTSTTDCGTNAAITYYATDSGVEAAPGETLEYCIQVVPSSNLSNATITDTIPVFTTFGTGVQFGGSVAGFNAANMAAGILIQSASGAAAGDVVATEKAGVVFTVTVDN